MANHEKEEIFIGASRIDGYAKRFNAFMDGSKTRPGATNRDAARDELYAAALTTNAARLTRLGQLSGIIWAGMDLVNQQGDLWTAAKIGGAMALGAVARGLRNSAFETREAVLAQIPEEVIVPPHTGPTVEVPAGGWARLPSGSEQQTAQPLNGLSQSGPISN